MFVLVTFIEHNESLYLYDQKGQRNINKKLLYLR